MVAVYISAMLSSCNSSFKRTKSFPTHALKNGRLPPKLPHVLTIFSLGLDLRHILLGSSSASQNERLRLFKLMLDYPEFTIAAIYSFYLKKATPATSLTSKIREYLLTETWVILPDGKRVYQVGASDYELAAAIAKRYGIYEAVYHGPSNELRSEKFVNLVKKTRQMEARGFDPDARDSSSSPDFMVGGQHPIISIRASIGIRTLFPDSLIEVKISLA
jgi:hypothetical protein